MVRTLYVANFQHCTYKIVALYVFFVACRCNVVVADVVSIDIESSLLAGDYAVVNDFGCSLKIASKNNSP
jgi:hypothetical protein